MKFSVSSICLVFIVCLTCSLSPKTSLAAAQANEQWASLSVPRFLPLYLRDEDEKTPLPGRKSVLFILPYQADLPYHALAIQAMQEEFNFETDFGPNLYYEFLDVNRFLDQYHQREIINLFTLKYRQKAIDLVVIANQRMLDLWLAHRNEILPVTPVVFYDIPTQNLSALQLPSDVTGVSSIVDHTQSVRWFLNTHPSVNEIVVIHGVGEADQEDLQAIKVVRQDLHGKIKFTDLSQLPMVEMKRRVSTLPQTSVILYHLLFEDAAGVHYRPFDALRELAAVSSVPILSGYDQFIGTGTIGGNMYSIEQQARQAARLGLRILNGESAGDIPIITNQSNCFIFDYQALQRYDIPMSILPPDGIIKNRQQSLWQHYRLQIVVLSLGVIGLLILVFALFLSVKKLNTTRLALTHLNVNLETQVQRRTAALSQINSRLETEINERLHTEEQLKESEEKYRFLTENISDVIWVMDLAASQFIYVSPSIEALTGHTASEMMALSLEQILISDSYMTAKAMIDGTLQRFLDNPDQHQLERREYEMKRKGGDSVWTETITRYYYNQKNQHIEIIGVSRDISARKLAEETLRRYTRQLESLQVQLREQAIRDPLTGTFNRRYLEETLEREVARANRAGDPLSLVMMDLDHFKTVNDTHGHLIGDRVLHQTAQVLQESIRKGDVVCRYGGEEFVLLFPQTILSDALHRCEDIQAALRKAPVQFASQKILVTFSIGIAELSRPNTSADMLLAQADRALYQAKAAGRDRIIAFQEGLASKVGDPYPVRSSSG